MNKYLLLSAISGLTFLSYIPSANAYNETVPTSFYDSAGDTYIAHRDDNSDDRYSQRENDFDDQYTDNDDNDNYNDNQELYHRSRHNVGGRNLVSVNLGNLTWEAYDDEGNLVNSGRVSGGKSYCPDIHRSCRTVQGTFTIYSKKGSGCRSSRFPVGKGGAPMPYCMFFHGGYALHGSNDVPNHNASHGCVRMPPDQAEWLNHNFVRVGSTRVRITY